MTEEAQEVFPFGFVDFGNTDQFKDFVPQPVRADEPELPDPKGLSAPESAASPVQESPQTSVGPEAIPVTVDSVPPPPDLDPSETPKHLSSSTESSGNATPPVPVPPPLTVASPVIPATPPIPSSPSEAKTTPPEK